MREQNTIVPPDTSQRGDPTTAGPDRAPRTIEWRPANDTTVERVAWVFILVLACTRAFLTLYHVATGDNIYLAVPADDFYYYAIVANNIAHHGISTFDGVTLTNGYHPLWMTVLAPLAWICGGIGPTFFIALTLVQCTAFVLFYRMFLRLGRELYGDRWYVTPAVIVIGAHVLPHMFLAMEVVIVMPLYVLVLLCIARAPSLESISDRDALAFGFLCSLLVLARLDAVSMVAIILAGWLWMARLTPQVKLRRLGCFCAGGILLPLYLGWNLLNTGHMVPVSGQAKQLTTGFGFSLNLMWGLIRNPGFLLLLVVGSVALILRLRMKGGESPILRPQQRLVIGVALLFPGVFLLIQGSTSDWVFWGWYSYWRPATLLVFMAWIGGFFTARLARHRLRAVTLWGLVAAGSVCLAVALWETLRDTIFLELDPDSMHGHAEKLAEFARTHPGLYAMGDRAGLAAYMIPSPVLQLEGLAADQRLVDHIGRESRLNDVLREYRVDYLIVSVYRPLPVVDGCYRVQIPDPAQSGPRSRRMRGEFCRAPLLRYTNGVCTTYVFGVGDTSRSPRRNFFQRR